MINLDRIGILDEYFKNKAPLPVAWSWILGDSVTVFDMPFSFAFNAAMQGGFFEERDGKIWKWEKNGSGSEAVNSWINDLRNKKMFPALDETVFETMEGQPYLEKRKAIIKEFMDPVKKRKLYNTIIGEGLITKSFFFGRTELDKLIEIYPESFGEDPLKKKALLVLLFASEWLSYMGHRVKNPLPIPSDYQMPRIFEYFGLIEIDDDFKAKLINKKLLDPSSAEVTAFRSAAIDIADELAKRNNIFPYQVDSALFPIVRKDKKFIEESLPPMQINTMWF